MEEITLDWIQEKKKKHNYKNLRQFGIAAKVNYREFFQVRARKRNLSKTTKAALFWFIALKESPKYFVNVYRDGMLIFQGQYIFIDVTDFKNYVDTNRALWGKGAFRITLSEDGKIITDRNYL